MGLNVTEGVGNAVAYVSHLARDEDARLTFCGQPWQGWQSPTGVGIPPSTPPRPHEDKILFCYPCSRRSEPRTGTHEQDTPEPGAVERSVDATLAGYGTPLVGLRGPLAQMALRMARAYDRYDGADLAKLARLNMELRQTLAAIAADGQGDDDGTDDLPPPVRDAEDAEPADVRPAGGGGGEAAGEAADAASA